MTKFDQAPDTKRYLLSISTKAGWDKVFFNKWVIHMCIQAKDKNCNHCHTGINIIPTSLLLLQWGKCCHRAIIPMTWNLLPPKIRREQITYNDLSQKTQKWCTWYKNWQRSNWESLNTTPELNHFQPAGVQSLLLWI